MKRPDEAGGMFQADLRHLWVWGALVSAIVSGRAADPVPVSIPALTNVAQVIGFGLERARREHPPVHLSGVVTLPLNFRPPAVFVHDGDAGLYVAYTNLDANPKTGDRVEVEGVVEAGMYLPMVGTAFLRRTGAGILPSPTGLTVREMKAGAGFGQWVEVAGVVRDMNLEGSRLALSVASEGQRVFCQVFPWRGGALPRDWLEAAVRLEGVCWTQVDTENRPYEFHLVVPRTNLVTVAGDGNDARAATEALGPGEDGKLWQQSDRRLKLTGTVVAHPKGGPVYLESRFGPVRAVPLVPMPRSPGVIGLDRQPLPQLEEGTVVTVLGSPLSSAFAPTLWDAEFEVTDLRESVSPTRAELPRLAQTRSDARLVTVRAQLRGQDQRLDPNGRQQVMVMQTGRTVAEAFWVMDGTNTLSALPLNGRVEVTGLVDLQPGFDEASTTVKLRLRSPADVHFLGPARPWEWLPTGRILLGTSLVMGVALVWAWILRRQVRLRTAQLAASNRRLEAEVEERERAQRELARSLGMERELNELKSRFVSMVSHEFRTPLGIIMSAVELLKGYFDRLTEDKKNELLGDIHGATRRMAGLMEQVLVLGRVEAGRTGCRTEPIDLKNLCARLVDESLSATNRRCPVELEAGPGLGQAEGDQTLIRHILSNLLSNAVKYSPEGSPVELGVAREAGEAVLTVRDRGIGIPEADQRQLFQAFYRGGNVGEVPGTGLGLLIVQRCVELHGGTLSIQSEEGRGTAFTVRLPLFNEQR